MISKSSGTNLQDFIVKKIPDETTDEQHTVKVFTNPFSTDTEVPQATFNRADGFFLLYDATKEDYVTCLDTHLRKIKEYKDEQTPVVILSLAEVYDNQQAIADLLADHDIEETAHF